MPILSAGLSDVGRKRKVNQDSIYLNPTQRLFMVADGMGGHKAGDIASKMATELVPAYLVTHAKEGIIKSCHESIQLAHQLIRQQGAANPDLNGMGTTTVLIYFEGATAYIANVGDSRIYLINRQAIYQLSRDHSLIQEKINLGIYGRQEALADPYKNVLTQAVGFENDISVEVFTYKAQKNDIFLLCSDGLHGKVPESDVVKTINYVIPQPATATEAQLQQATKALVALANDNGGDDNISAVLVLVR